MEMKLLHSFGYANRNVCYYTHDKYFSLSGSTISIRTTKEYEPDIPVVFASNTSFSCFDYNVLYKKLAACEIGRNVEIKIFDMKDGEEFIYWNSIVLEKAFKAEFVKMSKDFKKLLVVTREPKFVLEVYSLQTLDRLVSIKLPRTYDKAEFNPINSNQIALRNKDHLKVIEIFDSFPHNYTCKITETFDRSTKMAEERSIEKDVIETIIKIDRLTDFVWDVYNNIYVANEMGEVMIKSIVSKDGRETYVDEDIENKRYKVKNGYVTALLVTQRHVLAATSGGNIELLSLYFKQEIFRAFKLPPYAEYKPLEMVKEYIIKIPDIVNFQYNPTFENILALTKENNLYKINLKADKLSKEALTDPVDIIEVYAEAKFHSGAILGIKEVGDSSVLMSMSKEDKQVIFWELSKFMDMSSNILEYTPHSFELDETGNLLFVGSDSGVLRIYDVSNFKMDRIMFQKKICDFTIDRIKRFDGIVYCYGLESTEIYCFKTDEISEINLWGYIPLKFPILDLSYHSQDKMLLVLSRRVLLGIENLALTEYKSFFGKDIFDQFKLSYTMKAKKVDSDLNLILKDPLMSEFWLTGTDKYLRKYSVPTESFDESIKSKKGPENPIEEITGHNLDIVDGFFERNNLLSVGKDGYVQFRINKSLIKQFRSHCFTQGGVKSLFYSPHRKLIYLGGSDGSVFVIGEDESFNLPQNEKKNSVVRPELTAFDTEEFLTNDTFKHMREHLLASYNDKLKMKKLKEQSVIKTKLAELQQKLSTLISYNKELEEIEQLQPEEMVIDKLAIDKLISKGVEDEKKKELELHEELCLLEKKKEKLLSKTYNNFLETDEKGNKTNNNVRISCSLDGSKIFSTYPIYTRRDETKLNIAKQFRMNEIHSLNLRKAGEIDNNFKIEYLSEKTFCRGTEEYLINRFPGRITLIETEVKTDEAGIFYEEDGEEGQIEGSSSSKMAKYKLQRDPYESEYMKGNQLETGNEKNGFNPEDQLLKENINYKYKTVIEKIKEVDFGNELDHIESYSLLYSPFELTTSFRIRNQIELIKDIVTVLKRHFNKDFNEFINAKDGILSKMVGYKKQIDEVKEILTEVEIEDYTWKTEKKENQEWVITVEDGELMVERYYSKDELARIEEEKKKQEQMKRKNEGDTCFYLISGEKRFEGNDGRWSTSYETRES